MSRLLFKEGVSLIGIQPETVLGILSCFSVWASQLPKYDFILTSITDGKHSKNSLHYVGYAFDVRTRHLSHNQTKAITEALAKHLGSEFDTVLHENSHLHIEYQPERNR